VTGRGSDHWPLRNSSISLTKGKRRISTISTLSDSFQLSSVLYQFKIHKKKSFQWIHHSSANSIWLLFIFAEILIEIIRSSNNQIQQSKCNKVMCLHFIWPTKLNYSIDKPNIGRNWRNRLRFVNRFVHFWIGTPVIIIVIDIYGRFGNITMISKLLQCNVMQGNARQGIVTAAIISDLATILCFIYIYKIKRIKLLQVKQFVNNQKPAVNKRGKNEIKYDKRRIVNTKC